MPRYFENGLLSAIPEGGKSAFWGVSALWAGFAWGGTIAADEMNALHGTGIWGVIVTLGTVGVAPWGWILLLILPVFFVCSIRREWNRLLVASSTATFVGAIGLRYFWYGPDSVSPRPWYRLIYPIALLALALLVPLLLRLLRPRSTPPSSGPASPTTPPTPQPFNLSTCQPFNSSPPDN